VNAPVPEASNQHVPDATPNSATEGSNNLVVEVPAKAGGEVPAKKGSFQDRTAPLSVYTGEKSPKSCSDTNTPSQQGSAKNTKSPGSAWDTVLSATVPLAPKFLDGRTGSSASSASPKLSAWKAAASLAVNGQKNGLQKRHSTVSQQSDENDITQNPNLNEIPLAQVLGLRKEFESVSAPHASMTFQKLNKFQARMIRRQGDAVFKALRANNPLVVNKGKHTEKDVREQARKTAIQVFRSLKYWDYDEDQPFADCLISFEQYLAAVFHAKVKEPEKPHYDRASIGLKGILREIQEQTQENVDEESRDIPLEELDMNSLPERQRRLQFLDTPTEEELEAEWQHLQSIQKLELDAEEAAAFKLKGHEDAAVVDEGAETAEAKAHQVGMAELEAAQASSDAAAAEGGAAGDVAEGRIASAEGRTVSADGDGAEEAATQGAEEKGQQAEAEAEPGKAVAQVRWYVLTEAEVQYKLAQIENVRKVVNLRKAQDDASTR